jgi:hypothetical protein
MVAAIGSLRGTAVHTFPGQPEIAVVRQDRLVRSETVARATTLEDTRAPVRLKLSAAWAALMFLYAYGDIFANYRTGFIDDIREGKVFSFEVDQLFLVAISLYVAIPAVMVLLTLILSPPVSRWANVVLGLLYALTIVLSAIGEDYVYYYFLSILEGAIAVLIVWFAWNWPEQSAYVP